MSLMRRRRPGRLQVFVQRLTRDAPAPVGVTAPDHEKAPSYPWGIRAPGPSHPARTSLRRCEVARPEVELGQRSPSMRLRPQVPRQGARLVPRSPGFRVQRRSHPPCSSQPRPSGRTLRTHRRELFQRSEWRRRRTKTASLGRHYVRSRGFDRPARRSRDLSVVQEKANSGGRTTTTAAAQRAKTGR